MPDPQIPLTDRGSLESTFGKYQADTINQPDIPNLPYQTLPSPDSLFGTSKSVSPVEQAEQDIFSKETARDGKLLGGSQPASVASLTNTRYSSFNPDPNYDNEDAFALSQSWGDKAANGIIKMTGIAASTAISSSIGLINGALQWANTGKFSSFYNNKLTQDLDAFNKTLEDKFPHYTTGRERASDWYEPANIFTANFLFDKIIKNLGFSIGAAIPAGAVGKALQAVKLSSKLFALGETIAAVDAVELGSQLPRLQQLSTIGEKLRIIAGKSISALGSPQVAGQETSGFLVKALASTISSPGEASLEAYNNLNEFRTNRIKEYKDGYIDSKGNQIKGHGYAPTGADLEAINEQASNVGGASFALNMALLSGTEYVQLPKIMSSTFRGEKALVNETIKDAETGLLKTALPASGLAKRFYQGRNIASLFFNEAEAFEEGTQFGIQKGTQDYYNKKYRGENTDLLSSVFEGVHQGFFTSEGLENTVLGGLSGALMTSGFVGRGRNGNFGIGVSGKIGERGWTGYGGEKEINTEELVNSINNTRFYRYLKDGVEQSNRAVVLQQEREKEIRQGNILESKDLEFDYSHNYLANRIKWDRYDLVKDDINEARQEASTQAGFERLQLQGKAANTDTQQTFLTRLNNFERHAESVNNNYERLKNKYSGILTPDKKLKYAPEVIDQMVYAASKIEDYDQRIPELSKVLLASGIQVGNVLEEYHNLPISENPTLKNRTEYEKAVIAAQAGTKSDSPFTQAIVDIDALKVTDDVKEDLKQSLIDVLELSDRRNDFIAEYNKIKKSPQEYTEKAPEAAKETTPGQTVEVKTKDGVENVEIGTEYYLGSVVETDEFGNTKTRFPKLTILGENADGTIQIKDSNGQVRNVSKTVLESYKLGRVSDVHKDENTDFYFRNIDNAPRTFFNFGKAKGGKKEGVLTLEKGKLYFNYKQGKTTVKKLVSIDMFEAKKGYDEGLLSFGKPLSAKDLENIKSRKESGKTTQDKVDRIGNKLEIIGQLIDENNKKLEELNRKIFAKKEKLAKAAEDTAELATFTTKDKYGKVIPVPFNKVLQRSVSALTDLSSLKTSLEKEIEELQAYKDELEFNGAYFDELVQSIDELPTDSKEFLQELKDQYDAIINQSLSVGEQINAFTKLINDIKNIIKELTSFLQSAFTKFDKDYPDEIRNSLKDDEEIFKSPQDLKNYIADYTLLKDLKKDINLNEEKISPIVDKINDLYKELSQLEKEASAKWAVFNKFKQAVEEFKKQEAIKKEFLANKQVQETYFAQQKANEQNAGVPTEQYDGKQEPPMKDLVNALQSSTDPKWTANTADDNFHRRHQTFLFNQTSTNPKLFSQEEYKGVKVKDRMKILPVTSVTAEQLGFPKDWIPEQYRYNGSNAATAGIYYVYVIEEGDKLFYSDVNGNKLSDVSSKEALNPSILIYSNAESAKSTEGFTNKDDLNKEEVLKQWLNVREQIFKLSAESAQNSVQNFRVSRGFPNKTEGVSRNTNVVDAELVTENDLATNVVIQVPTVSSRFPVGVPLLNFNGNTVFLNNRNFSKEEATNIVDVLTYAASHKEGLTNEIFNYLRNVLYFSTDAKGDVKRNQIFLKRAQDQAPVLVVGVNQVEIPFNIDGLTNSREELIRVVENMYHHVNNTSLLALKDKPNTPFVEIGVNEKGDLYTKKEYPSYQHYLLQGTNAPLTANIAIPQNGEPSIKEKYSIVSFATYDPTKFKKPATPAPTHAKPSASTTTIVKDGSTVNTALTSKGEPVSFTVDAEGKISVIPNEQLQTIFDRLIAAGDTEEVAQAKIMNVAFNAVEESSKKPASAPIITGSASASTGLVYDGVTKNLAKSSKGEPVEFTVNADNNIEVIPSDSVANIYARLTEAGLSDADARQAILGVAINAVVADKQAEKAKVEEAQAEVVAPTAVPDIEAKKADIERRRKEELKKFVTSENKTDKYNIPVLLDPAAKARGDKQEYISREVFDIAFKNDDREGTNYQTADTLIRRGGYSKEELIKGSKALLKPEIDKINAKYDAELAALDNEETDDLEGAVAYTGDVEHRLVFNQWNKYEGNKEQETANVAQMLPKVNVKMVDHLIKTSGGGQAWGAARSAMMEIFKDAPFGTKYHEAFEQVFNWILPIEDQLDLVKEFNQREGTFTTFKGETKKFADATFKEAKEQMAEEFIEYKQSNTTPKSSNKIIQFFKDLWNLIKEFLNAKPATLASVFDKLNKGVYRMAPINTAKGIEYRERNVQGEAISFVNTVLAGMTADMFIDKWKNDVSLIMDLEEKPGYAETELFNNLLARLTDYYENNQNSAGIISYYANLLKEASTPKEKEDVLEQYNAIKQAWKRVKGQWVNYTADLKTFLKVFDVAFQVDDEGNLDLAADIDNGDEKNQKEYVDDKMSVNAKNSASKVVKLLLATISDSEFVKKTITNSLQTRGNDFSQVQPIRNNVMRMRMLAPYAKLFNYILYNTANIPGIYNIVDKLQDLSANTNLKQNANVKSLLNRIKYNPEKGFEGLSIPEIKLLLKLENALSKNKPVFIRQEVTEDGKTILKYSNIYDRVSQVSEQWNNGLKSLKYTTVSGDNIQFSKGILAADPYIFLSHLNIPLTKGSFPIAKEKELIEQIDAIKGVVQKYIDNPLPLTTKGKSVGIDSRINKLAKFYVENVEGESTESQHLNMAGKVTSNFVLPNFISHILSDTNIAPTLERFIELNPQYKDLYMGASYFLNNIMYKNGVRNKSLSVVVVEGKNIQNEGRPTDKMNEGERMLYEINNNLNGYYYSLMPSDSKLEYALNTGNVVDESFFNSQGKVKATSNYVDAMYASFLNEVELMKDYKNRTNIEALNRKQDGVEIGKQLRFFKYILSASNANKVESGTAISKEEFASDLLAFVDKQAKQNIEDLSSWGLIEKGEYSDGNPYNVIHGVDANFMKKNFNKNSKAPYVSNSELLELYTFREMNYIFNNIEMHRLIFNDPAQYKDELKRTKSFTSGRENTHVDILNDQRGLNDALKNTLNKGLKPTDIGWTNFKNYLNSVTIREIKTVSKTFDELKKVLGKSANKYQRMEIADAQSWAHGNAYREILYKSGGRFTAQQEELHQWLMAWERRDKNKYSSEELRKSDAKILEKPIPSSDKHIMYILKPIVSGTKLVNGVAVQYLYKTSTAPLYAYFVKGTPLEGVHNSMTTNNIDFLAMQSANKVGGLVDNTIDLLNPEGQVNEDFKTVTPTPIDYKYFGIQVDTASKKESQTQGSQLTKLATIDLMLAGVPIDFINKHNTKSQEDIQELWDAIPDKTTESKVWSLVKDHKDVLIALAIKRGEKVFNKLGIKEGEFGFTFRDKATVADFLLQELESRELPSNIKDGVWVEYNPDTDSKEFRTPLEANVNYQKIKQILWSVIEKGVTRPKMPGGPKVQMSVAGMGNIKEVVINGKKAYVDDTLKYYGIDENGDTTPCEIDLPYFFGEQLRESLKAKGKTFKNDDEFFSHVLNYLNNTKDGQALIQGIGFRIPTQKPNSIEYFKVRKFLAPQLGDVVVLPAEITTKAGSDFDVDKLNTYLKNWYIGKSGYPKVVKLQSLSADDTQKLTDLYEYTLKNKRKAWENRQPINDLMNDIFPSQGEENDYVPSLEEFLANAKGKSSLELNSIEALENHYIETLEKLMALPESFKSLVSPNDASQLETLSAKIQELTNNIDVDINPGHLISSNFMAKKRNTMLASKGSVGISAVSATNQAINQLYNIIMSIPKKVAWRNVAVRFPHNTINGQISLSGVYTKSGDNISDINSQFTDGSVDVAKKEWLPRLGFTDAVISTALLMNKWGTPIEDIAYFINQPAIQAYLKAIEKNKVISKYTGKKEKQNTKIQEEVGAMFSKDKIGWNRKNKPSQYILNGDGKQSGMADMIGKKEFSKAEGILQLQMLDDFIAYQTMAYELLAVVQGYNYDTARITSPEDMYKKEMDEDKADKSSVNSVSKIMTNSYVGKVAEVAKKINKALKTLINTQSGEAGSIIRAMAFDLKKHFGIGNNADNYSKYMNKAEAAMIDYIVQNKARIKGLPLNTYTSALLSSAYSSAQYIQKLKQDINNNPTHPLVNNTLLKNFITDIDLTKKKPSTVSIAEPDFDTFTSDSYTDQFRELLSSSATVEIPGVANSNRTVADVFQSLIVAQILQNGSSRKKGSFFHLIPNEVYAEYAAPVLQKIEADLDWFYNQGLFYRNNYKDSKLVPYLRPDLVTFSDEIVHDTRIFNGKQIFFVNSSNYYSFPFVKITNRAEGTTRLFKRIDSVDVEGNKSPVIIKRPEDEEPDGKLINKVAYQEVNILGDGNKAQEYYEDKLTSLYNPHITEIPDYQLIAEMEKSLGSNNIKYESAPLLSEGDDVSSQDMVQGELFDNPIKGTIKANLIKDLVFTGKAVTTIRSNSYHNSFYKGDGVYTIENNGKNVNIVYLGIAKKIGDHIDIVKKDGDVLGMTLDEFGKDEGFDNWAGFLKNQKYSDSFISGEETRHMYSITPAVENKENLQIAEQSFEEFKNKLKRKDCGM